MTGTVLWLGWIPYFDATRGACAHLDLKQCIFKEMDLERTWRHHFVQASTRASSRGFCCGRGKLEANLCFSFGFSDGLWVRGFSGEDFKRFLTWYSLRACWSSFGLEESWNSSVRNDWHYSFLLSHLWMTRNRHTLGHFLF